jgi:regulatory protein
VGGTITAIEVQQRNADRASIYLDGEYAFGLPLDEAARLHKGQVLSDEEIAALRAIDEIARAFDRAVRLLARRPYSTTEIRRHLESKAIAPPVVDEALARLEQLGYVDDRAFVEYWVENRERFNPRGPRALAYELRQKGIPSGLIDEVLAEVDSHDSAYRAAQEKARRWRGLSRADFYQKLGAFLTRRGFDYSLAREVIEQTIRELEDEDPEYFATDDTTTNTDEE